MKRLKRAKAVFLAVVVVSILSGYLRAQVVELTGGSSTMFQSQGGTVVVHGRSYTASAGAGTVGGEFYGGAHLVMRTGPAMLTLGSDVVPLDLPTDVFEGGHYLTVVGAGARAKAGRTNLYGFAGATSTNFDSPFFDGVHAESPAAIVFVTADMAPGWISSTKIIVSPLITSIQSFDWNSGKGTKFAVSGGLGSGQLYGATSMSIYRPRFDVKAAYFAAASQFRRADVATPLTSESDRENVVITIRPSTFLNFTIGRQNYLSPIYQSKDNLHSVVNQVSGNMAVAGFGLSALLFQSTSGTSADTAVAYVASRAITSRVHAQATYLESMPNHSAKTDSFVTNVQEVLTPRWTLSQTINTSEGQSTFSYGGSFLSNFASLSADYQTYYVPTKTDAPFEQALMLNAQVHLFGRLTLDGGTFVAPNGKLLYTTEAEATVSRQMSGQAVEHHGIGSVLLRGRVVDSKAQPITGAALLIDQLPVYTDSQGYFYVRERRPHTHSLTVLVDQFLEGGLYRVVSAPNRVMSSSNDQADPIIVVERITTPTAKGVTK